MRQRVDSNMQNGFFILVADRNPRIRNLIERELRTEGYQVLTVETVTQLMHWINPARLPDLVVLDPDLPGSGAEDFIRPMLADYPHLPVVFHCLVADIPVSIPGTACTATVEKSADSIDLLKRQIALLLKTNRQE